MNADDDDKTERDVSPRMTNQLWQERLARLQDAVTDLADLGSRLSAAQTPEEAARITADVASRLLGWDACRIALSHPDTDEMTALLCVDTRDGQRVEADLADPAQSRIDAASMLCRAVREGACLLLRTPEDLAASHSDAEPLSGAPFTPCADEARRAASLMCVPMRCGSRVNGALCIHSYRLNAYDEPGLTLLQALADHCSGAIERILLTRTLRASEYRYQMLAENSGLGIWQVTPEGATLYANPAMCSLLEVSNLAQLAGTRYYDFFTPEGLLLLEREYARQRTGQPCSYEVEIVTYNGARRDVLVCGAALLNDTGEVESLIGTYTDMTERNRILKTMQWQAYHDVLTGLPNRELFHDRLIQQIASSRRNQSGFAILFLDLDLFKHINDTLGHDVGDKLLKIVSMRFARCVRAGDTIARMGGDEFTLLLPDVPGADQAIRVVQKLQAALSEPVRINERSLLVTASIGISLFPGDGQDSQTLLKHADAAMYRAKERGRNNYQFYTQTMSATTRERLVQENSLRQALENQEFVLVYQPQVALPTGVLIGVEALVRWRHPELGIVEPDDFLGLAEEMGLMGALGEWVLSEACRQAAIWQAHGLEIRVSINLTGRQFRHASLPDRIAGALALTGMNASGLELEMTESELIVNADQATQALADLKRLGVRLAIDDFGTGYSSFSHLRRFPLDVLKIDRSLVEPLTEDRRNEAVVHAMIELAHALDMQVVAEGVETQAQRERLLALHCDIAQGYLFSPPLPLEQLEQLLYAGYDVAP